MKDEISFSQAFNELLKELSIQDFPSGGGKWRNELRYSTDLMGLKSHEDNADLFSVESLLELNETKPFDRNTDWSTDCKKILDKSTKNPPDVDYKNIYKYFKKLRIVNKNVKEIDEEIQKFQNLEELALSANHIKTICGKYLPRSLKVLELCGNELSDIGNLCCHPPPLNHLGLSYNSIFSIQEYMKPQTWEKLLSLDLCHNCIDNLTETVNTLSSLPKLRNLLLKGNPVFFFIGYDGYVIDSLKSLSLLDDKVISADERYYYKGFSKIKDLPINEFVLDVSIDQLKGLMRIDEQDSMMDEYPKRITKYHVEFDFISSFQEKDESFFEVKTETSDTESSEINEVTITTEVVTSVDSEAFNTQKIIKTTELPITDDEDLNIDYHKLIISNKTKELHHYLKEPIKLRVIANHIIYSNEPKPDDDKVNTLIAEPLGGAVNKEKSNKSVDKQKSKNASVAKMSSNESGKGKPKSRGKHENIELFEWSRRKIVYATGEINCTNLLDDTKSIDKEVVFEISPEFINNKASEGTIQEENSAKKLLDTKKKTSKEMSITSARSMTSTKARNRKNMDPASSEVSRVSNAGEIPCPLTAHISIKLLRWETAKKAYEQTKLLATIFEQEF